MATVININISGYGVSQSTKTPDPYRTYRLLPGFTATRELFGERKIKAKKKKNCSNGQVCGFSCISKTKVCIAEMTTAQLKEHNVAKRAQKKSAKGGGGGAVAQSVGGNVTLDSFVDIVDMNIGKHDAAKAEKLSDLYLQGSGPIRPVFVKADSQGLDVRYNVTGRQDEAAAYELARQKDKFFSLARTVIVTKDNEAAINEQIKLTSGIKREIPQSNAPPSTPYNPMKKPKNEIGLFDIVSIQDSTKFSADDQKQIESLAKNYAKIGNIDPILLRVKGVNKETFDNDYEVLSGKLEFAALKRAKELNPSFELAKALVVDESNESSVIAQLSTFYP